MLSTNYEMPRISQHLQTISGHFRVSLPLFTTNYNIDYKLYEQKIIIIDCYICFFVYLDNEKKRRKKNQQQKIENNSFVAYPKYKFT